MLGYAGWYGYSDTTTEILFFIPFMQVLVIGPVVYFYIRSLLNPSFRFSRKDWIHFVPGILYLLYSIVVFITDKYILDEFYFYADGRDKDLKAWYQILGLFSMLYYLVLSLRTYLSYKNIIFNVVSYADSILFRWIQNFLIALLLFVVLRIVFFFTNPQWENFGSQFWYYLSFGFIMLYISISGYAQSVKSTAIPLAKVKPNFEELEDEKTSAVAVDIDKWYNQIVNVLEGKKIFENPQLTLLDVAKELNTNSKTISSSINLGAKMNFNDFINHYRIEAIKDKLRNGEHQQTTLLGIALESGFNSKATFNRAFKKSTGTTPKDFIENLS